MKNNIPYGEIKEWDDKGNLIEKLNPSYIYKDNEIIKEVGFDKFTLFYEEDNKKFKMEKKQSDEDWKIFMKYLEDDDELYSTLRGDY